MEALKRCPFCGALPHTEVMVTQKGGETDNIDFSIVCNECGIYKTVRLKIKRTALFDDVEKAMNEVVEAWNRRANDE